MNSCEEREAYLRKTVASIRVHFASRRDDSYWAFGLKLSRGGKCHRQKYCYNNLSEAKLNDHVLQLWK